VLPGGFTWGCVTEVTLHVVVLSAVSVTRPISSVSVTARLHSAL
jgi:hypothetical protein